MRCQPHHSVIQQSGASVQKACGPGCSQDHCQRSNNALALSHSLFRNCWGWVSLLVQYRPLCLKGHQSAEHWPLTICLLVWVTVHWPRLSRSSAPTAHQTQVVDLRGLDPDGQSNLYLVFATTSPCPSTYTDMGKPLASEPEHMGKLRQ